MRIGAADSNSYIRSKVDFSGARGDTTGCAGALSKDTSPYTDLAVTPI